MRFHFIDPRAVSRLEWKNKIMLFRHNIDLPSPPKHLWPFFRWIMSAWYDGVYLPRNRYTVPLVSLRDGLNSEKLWCCGERMPSHACMPAMRSGVRNLFFANKSIQQHGSPAVHNVPQVRLSGTNRTAHLTIWNPTRLCEEHKHSPSHASLAENMSEAFWVCNEKLILQRLALCYNALPAGSSISPSPPNISQVFQNYHECKYTDHGSVLHPSTVFSIDSVKRTTEQQPVIM